MYIGRLSGKTFRAFTTVALFFTRPALIKKHGKHVISYLLHELKNFNFIFSWTRCVIRLGFIIQGIFFFLVLSCYAVLVEIALFLFSFTHCLISWSENDNEYKKVCITFIILLNFWKPDIFLRNSAYVATWTSTSLD